MLGPFATTSRLTPIQQMSLAALSRAACASMSTTTTTTTTTTTRDRGDRYGPMGWAQWRYMRRCASKCLWGWCHTHYQSRRTACDQVYSAAIKNSQLHRHSHGWNVGGDHGMDTTEVGVDSLTFPPPLLLALLSSFAPIPAAPTLFLHPFPSSSSSSSNLEASPMGSGGARPLIKSWEPLSIYASSPMKKMTATKVRGDQIYLVPRLSKIGMGQVFTGTMGRLRL